MPLKIKIMWLVDYIYEYNYHFILFLKKVDFYKKINKRCNVLEMNSLWV